MLARTALVAFGAILIFGCGGGEQPTTIPEWGEEVPAYLPYVENITLPERLVEGEPFTMTIELSAELRPDILNDSDIRNHSLLSDFPHPRISILQYEYEGTDYTNVRINTWIIDPKFAGEPVASVDFEIPELQAGELWINVHTADSGEHGGFLGKARVETPPTIIHHYPHEHATTREYKFDVLPAEGGGEE